MLVEVIATPILVFTRQPIFGIEPIMFGLPCKQVIHKRRECLDVQGNASVILLLVPFLDGQFS